MVCGQRELGPLDSIQGFLKPRFTWSYNNGAGGWGGAWGCWGFRHRKKMRRKMEDLQGEHRVGTKEKEKGEVAVEEGS